MAKQTEEEEKAAKKLKRYKMQNKKTFLLAWCQAMVVENADFKTFVNHIRAQFDKKNVGCTRTDDQVADSIVLKARSIKKELLEMGKPCPPIPTRSGNSDIVSVEQALKDETLSMLLTKWE